MQLCQTTEGVTDQGEIRLPAAKSSSMQSPALGGQGQSSSGAAASSSSSGAAAAGGTAPPPPSTAWVEESSASGASDSTPASASAAPAAAAAARSIAEASAAGGEGGGDNAPSGGAQSAGGGGSPKPSCDRSAEGTKHFESIVSELFQGHVVSTVRCLECQRSSRMKEPIYDVSVQIPNPNELVNGTSPLPPELTAQAGKGPQWMGMLGNVTGKVKGWFYDKGVELTDCLRKFCAPEYLVGKDKYECEHCKRKTDGERRFAFKDLPEVLCIHIKRFRYDSSWFNAQKNSRVVNFPVNRTLDMSSFLEEVPAHPVEYRLIGLIQHIGSMGGGHYISYCQHKRKPQEWYEFDDTQVSTVSAEQVERAEPYVLFYQRQPSKGIKFDRQTFKTDRRKMQAQIRQLAEGRGGGGDTMSAHAAEELRHHGPLLRNLYRNPPKELDMVFVSKHWYVRLTTMSQPGPLDNHEYLCPHRLLGCYSAETAAEPFIPISRALFESLVRKYGGGPVVCSLEVCAKCQAHLKSFNDRKQAEYDLVSKYDTKDTGDGKGWYLVDALWVNKWKRYVKTEHVTDIRDMSAPGFVSNDRLFDKNGVLRTNLRIRTDYIGVNGRVWWLFQHVHGGGPPICREELDVYSESHRLEDELKLEELALTGSSVDLARRISWQYVDECQGSMELYEEKYGAGAARAASAENLSVEDAAPPDTATAPFALETRLGAGEAPASPHHSSGREPPPPPPPPGPPSPGGGAAGSEAGSAPPSPKRSAAATPGGAEQPIRSAAGERMQVDESTGAEEMSYPSRGGAAARD